MWSALSAVGQAAYKTAAMTGLAAGTEQPPYPCAWPLQKLDDVNDTARVQEIVDASFAAAKDMLTNNAEHQWKIVEFQDPDKGGDLHLFTRPHIGPFNFAKATMSLQDCSPEKFINTMFADQLEGRKKYSSTIVKYEKVAKSNDLQNTHIETMGYWSPPPVAQRDFVYLVDKKYDEEEDSYYVYGCSIDYTPMQKDSKVIRGTCLWAWELTPIGNSTLATYVNVVNPRGWTPTFLIGWLKTELAKELIAARRVLYGEEVKLVRTTFESMGITSEELKLEEEADRNAVCSNEELLSA